MRTGAAILVKILRKCALRETHARAPDRSCAHRRRTRRPLTAYSVLGSTPSWPGVATRHSHKGASLDAVSAFDLSGHEPADAGGHADRKQRLDSEHRSPRGHSSTAPLLSCRKRLSRHPRCAPSTRTWPSHTLVGLSFNALVHYGADDRALTSPAADRRKTKPSDREARARPGDRDPPTPKGTAERSVRA